MRILIAIFVFASVATVNAQQLPMHKDSAAFVSWATACTVVRGLQDISDASYGYATVGDANAALGKSGENGVVSLGDGGAAILTFKQAITDGPGYDFAVFENSFTPDFLELAFVEVSSDGIHFVRFPNASTNSTTIQIGAFDTTDAQKITNLAGKFMALQGTPFDLSLLIDSVGLDILNITHVKVIDVVGSINATYASYDSQGNIINDPWPTPFPSSGFDLDAVGVIHQKTLGVSKRQTVNALKVFRSIDQRLTIELMESNKPQSSQLCLFNVAGQLLQSHTVYAFPSSIDLRQLPSGIYFISVQQNQTVFNVKFVLTHE